MKEKFLLVLIILISAITSEVSAQICDPSKVTGPNLVTNGGFESGDTGFYTDLACSWNDPGTCSCHGDWSTPNEYYIGSAPNEVSPCGNTFQSGFVGSPHSGSNFMMIDGIGETAAVIWGQTVSVEPGTYYYFEVWISTIGTTPVTTATLKFNINGVEQPATISAPSDANNWVRYHQLWYSDNVSGNINIEISDIQPHSSGPDEDDFGLDDISFQIGCPPDEYVGQPNLGPDLSFCGTDQTSFTLDPNVTLGPGQSFTWSTSSLDSGKTTIDVNTPGNYYVCLNQAGSCTKIDSINITDDFTIDLGSDVTLCDPASVTLDAQHSGFGVSYQWYKDGAALPLGTSQTLFVNSSGLYKVDVIDQNCEDKSDSVNVTIESGFFEPNNVDFCMSSGPDTTITFSVSPSGNLYNWYDVPTGGAILTGGDSTSSYALSGVTIGDTLYVEDISTITHPTFGPNYANIDNNGGGPPNLDRAFDAQSDLIIESVFMKSGPNWGAGPCNGKAVGDSSNAFKISVYKDGLLYNESGLVKVKCFEPSKVTLNLSIPQGTNYFLRAPSGNGAWEFSGLAADRAAFSIPDVIDLPARTDNSGAFFNWTVKSYSSCARVPVMARDICVLPVELIQFFGYLSEEGNVILIWSTATEKNNQYFEIERITGDEVVTVGKIEGAGNSNDIINYQFLDREAPDGVLYYRIKQVDFDGTVSYSNVITINNTIFNTVLYPNPSNDFATLVVHSISNYDILIRVYDAVGRELEQHSTSSNKEIQFGQNYEKGVYFISIWNGVESKQLKFVKQ